MNPDKYLLQNLMFYWNYSYSLSPQKPLLMSYHECNYLRGWPNICIFQTCVWLLLDSKFLAIKCIQVLDLLWRRDRHQVWFLICLIWLLLLLLLCHRLQRSTVHAIDWKFDNSVFQLRVRLHWRAHSHASLDDGDMFWEKRSLGDFVAVS